MSSLISIFINYREDSLIATESLNSIINQSYKNWEAFLFTSVDLKVSLPSKFKIINLKEELSFSAFLTFSLSISNGEFISLLNLEDIISEKKLEQQLKFILKNDLNLCSCLECPFLEIKQNNKSIIANEFTKKADIDFAISAGYIPINFYTLLIRKSYLVKFKKLLDKDIRNPLEFLLLLFKYDSIEKVPEVLYFYKKNQITYEKNLNMDNSLKTTNKIALFNRNKFLENRGYLLDSLNSHSNNSYTPLIKKTLYNSLIIIENLNIGGTESYLKTTLCSLKQLGIKFFILTSYGLLNDFFKLNDISLIEYPEFFNFSKEFQKLQLKIIIKELNISFIWLHNAKELNLLKDFELSIPLIVTIHGNYYPKELLLNSKAIVSKFIFVSKALLNYYKEIFPNSNKAIVIPNSIDKNLALRKDFSLFKTINIPENSKILTYCSRLSSKKGNLALAFIKSFINIINADKNTYALILGDGPFKIELLNYVKKLDIDLQKRIFIIGSVYNSFDYFLQSYLVIGTGRVALEGLRAKKPVITLGLAGFQGIVSNNNIKNLLESNFADHSETNSDISLSEIILNLEKSITLLLTNSFYYKENSQFGYDFSSKFLNIDNSAKILFKLFETINSNFKAKKE
ncbi:MAG: glycosyltransferase [Sarcina sp.]